MQKALIKKQIIELFHTYYIDKKTGKKKKKSSFVMFIFFMILVFGGLGIVFLYMGNSFAQIIIGGELNWLYFALMGLIAIALGVFGSVFNTYAGLYMPKDNEFLISLPIPSSKILLARLVGVYSVSFMYSAWMWIPITIAYWFNVELSFARILCPIVMAFVIALLVTVLSCALGWIVALIASKAKGKSFLTVFLSLAVIAIYYIVYFKIVNSLSEILAHLDEIGDIVKSWLGFIYIMGCASDGAWGYMAIFLGVNLALAALCMLVLSKSFVKFATADQTVKKNVTKEPAYRQNTSKSALFKRELKHFTSLPTWMLNNGLGLLLMPCLAVLAIVKRETLVDFTAFLKEEWIEVYNLVPLIVFITICLIVSMNCITAPAVSLEGKTMWILQTLPIEPWAVLEAKEKMHVRLNAVPALITTLILGLVVEMKVGDLVLVCVGVAVFILFTADLGLVLNLKHPNLSWTSENVPTKQSFAVFVVLFGGWLANMAVIFAGYVLSESVKGSVVMAIAIVIYAAAFVLMKRWLKTKGTEILRYL